jgi:hypothetical protein
MLLCENAFSLNTYMWNYIYRWKLHFITTDTGTDACSGKLPFFEYTRQAMNASRNISCLIISKTARPAEKCNGIKCVLLFSATFVRYAFALIKYLASYDRDAHTNAYESSCTVCYCCPILTEIATSTNFNKTRQYKFWRKFVHRFQSHFNRCPRWMRICVKKHFLVDEIRSPFPSLVQDPVYWQYMLTRHFFHTPTLNNK